MSTPSDVVLSGYLVTGELGRGGQARVLRAEPEGGGPAVAVKLAIEPELVHALRAEGVVLRRLEGPRFVRVLAEHLDEEPPFVVLELCPGGDLRRYLDAAPAGRLDPAEAERIVALVLEGMASAHDEGVVHGDLKPENILLDARREPKIADLGLSRADRQRLAASGSADVRASLETEAGRVRGTFDYLAPEVRAGRELSTQSDVYALGVLLYELLTGQRPVGIIEPPGAVLARSGVTVPPQLDRLCRRALARDPRERYPDAALMLDDLRAGATGIELVGGADLAVGAAYEPLVRPIPHGLFFSGLSLMTIVPAGMNLGLCAALGRAASLGDGAQLALGLPLLAAPLALTVASTPWLRRRLGTSGDPPAESPAEPPVEPALPPAGERAGWRLAPGARVGPWLLLEPLGRGGFSEVWRAERGPGPAVALKVIVDAEHADGLRREASSLVRLRGEGIARSLAHDLEHDPPWLALELLPGGSLRDRLRHERTGAAPRIPSEALRLFERLVELLARVHREGLVHGDLKPENILFDALGRPHLSDFGLSRRSVQRSATLSMSRSLADVRLAGTVEYLAPDLRAGGRPTPASDVYALGVVLHELLLGDRPQGVARRAVDQDPRLPPFVERLLRRALAADARDRPESAQALLRALRAGLWVDGHALPAALQGLAERRSLIEALPLAWAAPCGAAAGILWTIGANGGHPPWLAFAVPFAVGLAVVPPALRLRTARERLRLEEVRAQQQRLTLRAWRALSPAEAEELDRAARDQARADAERERAAPGQAGRSPMERRARIIQRRALRSIGRAWRGPAGAAACFALAIAIAWGLRGVELPDHKPDAPPLALTVEAIPAILGIAWLHSRLPRRRVEDEPW